MKTYKVNRIKEKSIVVSGQGNHALWKKANVLTDFQSPWDDKPIDKIEFRSLYDSESIYFLFKVYDPKIHIHPSEDENDSINNSDRVELFFKADDTLNPYYCLEIDPSPRVMDFKAHPNKQFDFNWNWPKQHITVQSSKEPTFFTVEIGISMMSLNDQELINSGKIETGIYRAKYGPNRNGIIAPTWITWVNPKTETPNFHTPSSFGVLHLE